MRHGHWTCSWSKTPLPEDSVDVYGTPGKSRHDEGAETCLVFRGPSGSALPFLRILGRYQASNQDH